MADVVGKTIFSDGKGKLFFGYYKTDDGVQFVDYKTWKGLSFKDVSKGDTNKERVIKAILKNQKQFNKKVEFNMWSKKNNPSFEQKMDWFIQNGWISNINKGGIKESVNELKKLPSGNFSIKVGYPTFADYEKKAKTGDTILRYDKRGGMIKAFVNGSELDKNAEKYLDKVNGIIGGVVFLTKKGMRGVAQVPDYEKKDIGVLVLESKSVNESASRTAMEIGALTGLNKDAVQKFVDTHRLDIEKLYKSVKSMNLAGRINLVTAIAGKPGNSLQKLTIKLNKKNESVNERYTGNSGDKLKHKYDKNIEIELIEPTNKGWKVYQTDKGNKRKIAYFDKQDIVGNKSLFESVNEAGEDVNKAMIPGDVKIKLQKTLDVLNGKKLTYPQKLQVLGRVLDSMGIGKGELNKVSQKLRTKLESVNEAKFGYTDSTSSYINKHNNEYKIAERMNKGNEQKFYDDLQSMEDKIGYPKTMKFISNALRGYKVDMFKDPKIKNPADAQEALFLLSK